MADRFDRVHQLRTKVLEHLKEHRHASTRQLADALDQPMDRMGRVLRSMAIDLSELKVNGTGKGIIYSALVDKTCDAETLRDAMMHRRAETVRDEAQQAVKRANKAKKKTNIPGYVLHKPGEKDKPIPNQGGQGCARPRRGSSLDYI